MSGAHPRFAYFGGEPLGAPTLMALIDAGYVPALVVCNPDRPVGRHHTLTAPAVKIIATERGIPVLQPERITDEVVNDLLAQDLDLFIVVAYNQLLPERLITAPRLGTLNIHPSLLPKLRGASPIRSAILRNEPDAVGVSVMLMDKAMDHGPIIAQRPYPIAPTDWPIAGDALDAALTTAGAELLIETLPAWIAGTITPTPQDDAAATYCHKLNRADGELNIDPIHLPTGQAAHELLLRIRAFAGYPGTFFIHNGKRIKVGTAHLDQSNTLTIETVTPEGKKEQPWSVFLQSITDTDSSE